MIPVVGHSAFLSKGLANIDATPMIDIECNDVGGIRLGSIKTDLPMVGHPNARHRFDRFIRSFRNVRHQRLGLFEIVSTGTLESVNSQRNRNDPTKAARQVCGHPNTILF
jgi:hypothetical protein